MWFRDILCWLGFHSKVEVLEATSRNTWMKCMRCQREFSGAGVIKS